MPLFIETFPLDEKTSSRMITEPEAKIKNLNLSVRLCRPENVLMPIAQAQEAEGQQDDLFYEVAQAGWQT